MNAVQLLREQLKGAHSTQEATMSDISDEAAHFNDLKNAIPAGAAYAHSVISEDIIVSTMLAHKAPISADNAQTGLSQPMPGFDKWDQHENWYKTVKVDLPKLKEFAQKVYKASDDYLATLKDEDLDQELDLGAFGKHTLAGVISNFLILHVANLTGEISAAKGIQGLKGYPF